MQYSIKYFIRKFEAIPEERWLVSNVGVDKSGTHCAMGHCLEQNGGNIKEATDLFDIFGESQRLLDTNNGDNGTESLGSTPRQRILTALYSKLREGAAIK